MLACTIACTNYVPKARVFARSFRAHHPGARVVLCLVERTAGGLDLSDFDEVLLPSDLDLDELERFLFRHTVLEACTAIKARLLSLLLSRHPDEPRVFYVDPDVRVYAPFDEACRLLETSDILVTPHHVTDEDTLEAVRDNVFRTMMCGTYNLGFLGLRRSDVTASFLAWWHARLAMYCYVDVQHGVFVDQKWIDLACSFFDIRVLRDVGYNVANWNVSKRKLAHTADGVRVNGRPLVFFHFSKIDSGRDMHYFRRYAGEGLESVRRLRAEYKEELAGCGQAELRYVPWSYDGFLSGERIAPETRIAYRNNRRLQEELPRPFGASNEQILSA